MCEGYLHPLYAESFSEFGIPIYLPNAKGWLIKRQIPDTPYFDAMGPYPLFFCEKWKALTTDLDDLKEELVSITLVIAPRSTPSFLNFQSYFNIFRPYKDHYLLDLSLPLNQTISKSKRRNSKKVLNNVDVHLSIAPNIDLESWVNLYNCLIRRHNINGIRAFSRRAFSKQLAIPNTHCFWVSHQGRIVGGNLYYLQGNIAYAHLSAFSEEGYELGAPYAVKWTAIQTLKEKVQWINFGGGTRSNNSQTGGLELFKRGWSSIAMKSYFCGKILIENTYQELVFSKEKTANSWFPAYRNSHF